MDSAVLSYQTILNRQEYGRKSIWANLDEENAGKSLALYHIDTGYVVNYNGSTHADYRDALIDAYITYVNNITSIPGIYWSDDITYIRELFSISAGGDGNIYVTAYGEDEEHAKELGEAVGKELDTYKPTLESMIGSHKLTKISELNGTVRVSAIKDSRNAVVNDIAAGYSSLNSCFEGFNLYQCALFYYDFQETYGEKFSFRDVASVNTANVEKLEAEYGETHWIQTEEDVQATETYEDVAEEELEEEPPEYVGRFKGEPRSMAMGFMAGVFFGMVLIGGRYIIRGTIKTGNELSDPFQLFLIGSVEEYRYIDERKATRLDKWLYRLKTKGTSRSAKEDYMIETTRLACGKAGVTSLVIACAEEMDETSKSTVQKLADGLGFEVKTCEGLGNDEEALRKISQTKTCILVGQIDKTRRDDFARVINILEGQEIWILGAIAV